MSTLFLILFQEIAFAIINGIVDLVSALFAGMFGAG